MSNKLAQVVIFQEDEKALNYRYRLPFQLNSNISVKSIEYDTEEFTNKNIKLVGPRPSRDSIYYLHPYKNNVYLHESIVEKHLLEEKLALYRRVGYLVGAKSINTKVVSSNPEKLSIDAEGKVQKKILKVEANFNSTKESKEQDSLEVYEEYSIQDNFDLNKNIDVLNNIIVEYNLHHEIGLKSLIDSRDSRDSGTMLTKKTISSEITSEYNSLLKISAQLSSPIFSASTDFKQSIETVKKLNINIEFVF